MINTPWMKIINMDLQAMGEYSDFIQFTINTYKIYPLKVLCERLILNFSLRPKFLQEYYIIGACICICITCFLSTPTGSISALSWFIVYICTYGRSVLRTRIHAESYNYLFGGTKVLHCISWVWNTQTIGYCTMGRVPNEDVI